MTLQTALLLLHQDVIEAIFLASLLEACLVGVAQQSPQTRDPNRIQKHNIIRTGLQQRHYVHKVLGADGGHGEERQVPGVVALTEALQVLGGDHLQLLLPLRQTEIAEQQQRPVREVAAVVLLRALVAVLASCRIHVQQLQRPVLVEQLQEVVEFGAADG